MPRFSARGLGAKFILPTRPAAVTIQGQTVKQLINSIRSRGRKLHERQPRIYNPHRR